MINILSYVGMNLQAEVCLWCLLGLVRTIFDATLFKVNANLKQVWQMNMPEELSMPVQRALRTMVSGIMLVQCFTVYVYLAAYIVLLYPVFLEERPTLVLPWLLLAAVRKLLCELTSLALGLGTCLLLGPARTPCITFVLVKFATIIPAFYVWMLVFSYYHSLKVAAAFKAFPVVLPLNDNDYGLELAVRRRRTKSLLREDQLRKKIVENFYGERTPRATNESHLRPVLKTSSRIAINIDASNEGEESDADVIKPLTSGLSDTGAYEDWFGSEIIIPRHTDRILEQIVLMLLRIGAYLKKEGIEFIVDEQMLKSAIPASWHQQDNIGCTTMNADDTETPPYVGSSKGNIASYLREYPQIFMKKQSKSLSQTELTFASLNAVHSHVETDEGTTSTSKVKQNSQNGTSHEEITSLGFEKVPSKKKITIVDSNTSLEDKTVKPTLPPDSQIKRMNTAEEKKLKSKRKKHRESEKNAGEIINKVLEDLQDNKPSAGAYKNDDINAIVEESLIQSKQLNINITKETSDTTVSNENTNEKTTLSQVSNVENNKLGEIVNVGKIALDEKKLNENNRESTPSRILNETKFDVSAFDSIVAKAGTSRGIQKDDNNTSSEQGHVSNDHRIKNPPGNKTFKEDHIQDNSNVNNNVKDINSEVSNANKTELTETQIHKDDKNKESPRRLPSDNNNMTESLDVKESNDDSLDSEISRKNKNASQNKKK